MLTRALGRSGLILVFAAAAIGTLAAPAYADYVYCPPAGGACYVVVTTPGSPGSGGDPDGGTGGGGGGTCTWAGQTVPCRVETADGVGWFNSTDGCYYFRANPPPPAGSPVWEGHQVGDGWVYAKACYPSDSVGPLGFAGVALVWLPNPPPGFGGLPSAAQLAAQAINQLPIRGPAIGIAPNETGAGLVGLPVWMWTAVSPETWGPVSATAAVPGLSVTATARATQIAWSMGDGHTVTCQSPGTPYEASFGNTDSPTCGYRYTRPGNRYTVTATTTWQVTWSGGGASGSLTVTRASTVSIRIDELQVVTS